MIHSSYERSILGLLTHENSSNFFNPKISHKDLKTLCVPEMEVVLKSGVKLLESEFEFLVRTFSLIDIVELPLS